MDNNSSGSDRLYLVGFILIIIMLIGGIIGVILDVPALAVFCLVFATTFAALRALRLWLARRE